MDQDLAGVLSFCNEIRQKLGRKPVAKLRKGEPGHPFNCAVAATINYKSRNRVGVDSRVVDYDTPLEGNDSTPCPPYVSDFVINFDDYQYPWLVGKGWAE